MREKGRIQGKAHRAGRIQGKANRAISHDQRSMEKVKARRAANHGGRPGNTIVNRIGMRAISHKQWKFGGRTAATNRHHHRGLPKVQVQAISHKPTLAPPPAHGPSNPRQQPLGRASHATSSARSRKQRTSKPTPPPPSPHCPRHPRQRSSPARKQRHKRHGHRRMRCKHR